MHAVVARLPEFLKHQSRDWHIAQEVGVGRCIADLVIVLNPPRGRSAPRGALNATECVVLSTLRHNGPTRIDILERRSGMARGSLRRGALRRLRDWQIIDFGPGGRVALAKTWSTQSKIIAIEAKLTDWRNAMRQAASYQRYADEVYALLPATDDSRNGLLQSRFRTEGIGLLFISDGGLLSAAPSGPCSAHGWEREFVMSRVMTGHQGQAPCKT